MIKFPNRQQQYLILKIAGFSVSFLGILTVSNLYYKINFTEAMLLVCLVGLPLLQMVEKTIAILISVYIKKHKRLSELDLKSDKTSIFENIKTSDPHTLIVLHEMFENAVPIADSLRHLEAVMDASGPEFTYALFLDPCDHEFKESDDDVSIWNAAINNIHILNERKRLQGFSEILLLTRGRVWSNTQQCFIGWERKRGKLIELNRFLLGESNHSINLLSGQLPEEVEFIITLDSDTLLTNDAAMRMVDAMRLPCNLPKFNDQNDKLLSGYIIGQPYCIHIENSLRSPLLFHSWLGRTRYLGKGIYHLKGFHQQLNNRFQEEWILSHDIIESFFAPTLFIPSTAIVDTDRSSFSAKIDRSARWFRGEFQFLPLLWDKKLTNHSSIGLYGWMTLTELWGRGFAPINLTILIGAGPFLLPNHEPIIVCFITIYFWVFNIFWKIPGMIKNRTIAPARKFFISGFRYFTQIPFLGWISLVELIKCLYRLFFSNRNLLEWRASGVLSRTMNESRFSTFYLLIKNGVLITMPIAALLLTGKFNIFTSIVLISWLAAPIVLHPKTN